MSLSLLFFSPVQLRRSDRVALMGTWHPAKVNPPHMLLIKGQRLGQD